MNGRKILAILYWAILVYLLFFAFYRAGTNTKINLVPFKTISELTYNVFVIGNDWKHWVLNIFGNVLVFIPVLPSIKIFSKRKISLLAALLIAILLPIAVEFLQYVFQIGAADIDDVLLNAIGIAIGYYLLLHKFSKEVAKF